MCQLIFRYYQHCGHVTTIFDHERCTYGEKNRRYGPMRDRHRRPWVQSHTIPSQCIICFSTSVRLLAQQVNEPRFPPILWRIDRLVLPWSQERYSLLIIFGRPPLPAQVEQYTRWADDQVRGLDYLDATPAAPGEPERIDHVERMQQTYDEVRCRPDHTLIDPWEVSDLRRFLHYLELPLLEDPEQATPNCHRILIRFASCGHFNHVFIEKPDQSTGKAECGCERFGQDLMVRNYAESLGSCMECRDPEPAEDRALKRRYWQLVKFDDTAKKFVAAT